MLDIIKHFLIAQQRPSSEDENTSCRKGENSWIHIANRGLVSRKKQKEVSKFNSKKANNQIGKWEKTWNMWLKRMCRWQINTWKDVQRH